MIQIADQFLRIAAVEPEGSSSSGTSKNIRNRLAQLVVRAVTGFNRIADPAAQKGGSISSFELSSVRASAGPPCIDFLQGCSKWRSSCRE
jgi:hypothetical protein